jgi:hypothetical protein
LSVASPSAASETASDRRQAWLAFAIWLGLLLLIIACEASRWLDPQQRGQSLAGWLCGRPARWLPFLPWVIAGCCITWPRRGPAQAQSESADNSPRSAACSPIDSWTSRESRRAWIASLFIMLIALLASLGVSRMTVQVDSEAVPFGDMPPAYHDEYSYRLQSETFLAGRTSFPSFEPHPELFDQMHVLNEGRMASRYFPGVGVWLLPGTAIGNPWLMQHIAHALAAWLVFWIGCELSSLRTGLIAGLLLALSPGVLLFSNLLLSHHATLVGLFVFLYAYLRMLRTPRFSWALIAGWGLTFAMLCRPMTAAGFALPMGVWAMRTFGRRLLQGDTRREAVAVMTCLGGPILIGLGVMLWYNQQITGDWRVTPYSLYTETYTPRHVYGFHNAVRGEQRLGPKVLDNYDRWAENLTPVLAVRNVGERLLRSGDWTLGIVPIALGVLGLFFGSRFGVRWWLIISSIISLHAVHVPYWFAGIMGWHYVFETAPLWLLLASEGFRRWSEYGLRRGPRGLRWCIAGILFTALAVNIITIPPLWPAQLAVGVEEIAFARTRYYAFEHQVEELRAGKPAVVLIIPDPADRSMDYVTNHAGLDGDVLRVRWNPEQISIDGMEELFPGRIVIVFDSATRAFQ